MRGFDKIAQQDSVSRRAFLASVGLAVGIPLLAACAPAASTTPAGTSKPGAGAPAPTTVPAVAQPTTSPAASQPRTGGTLRVGTVGDMSTVDGHYYSSGKQGLTPWMSYDTLTRYDDSF